MSRLTEKGTFFETERHYQDTRKGNVIDKLGKLEDLEEELGIGLITLFKALKDGIYSRDYGHLLVEHFVLKHKQELHCRPTYRNELRFALKDYGKTWALCREELENGN